MSLTPSKLSRAAGVAAALAGLLYITIQFIHPVETVAAVTTPAWAIVHYLSLAMAVLGLAGVAGIYLRQVRESGLLGLIGFLLLSTFFLAQAAFNFLEAFVLPAIASTAPAVVEDILGIFGGVPADGSLGLLEQVGPFAFLAYMLGGATFGIAIFRSRILPRWAGILLGAGALVTLALPLFPHQVGRFAAVPVGLALAWLGYSLWADRRKTAASSASGSTARLDRAAAH
jgi:hypothetical protein